MDVFNPEEIQEIIIHYHVSKTNHRGINETYNQINCKYYCPNIKNSVQEAINNWDICLQTKYERFSLKPELTLTPTAFDKTRFLTIFDMFSR